MEYTCKDGTKVIVNGDEVQYGESAVRKNVIGANFIHGTFRGGYLSTFNGCFSDELINVESGLGDIVSAKIGDISVAYEMLKSKIGTIDSSNIFELAQIVLETVDDFFGGFDNIDERMNYYYPDDFVESENNKISDLKGTGAAMCVERAAVSQNLLKSLGINSFMKISGITKNNNKEVHSYNLIEYDGRFYIFDSSMPSLINGQANPLIAEIDRETFDLLSVPISGIGISTTVSHYNPYRDIDVTITYDSGRDKSIEVNSLGEEKGKHL